MCVCTDHAHANFPGVCYQRFFFFIEPNEGENNGFKFRLLSNAVNREVTIEMVMK